MDFGAFAILFYRNLFGEKSENPSFFNAFFSRKNGLFCAYGKYKGKNASAVFWRPSAHKLNEKFLFKFPNRDKLERAPFNFEEN